MYVNRKCQQESKYSIYVFFFMTVNSLVVVIGTTLHRVVFPEISTINK